MERSAKITIALIIFLIFGVLMAGCSDSTSDTATPTPTTALLYSAGDIVRSPSGATSPAWLIVSSDPAGDSYTRALIYQNIDGTWGYRINPATETSKRAVIEKVYTVKVAHVTVASVPTAAPTRVTTAVTTAATRQATTTTGAVTTVPSAARPVIKAMDPEEGEAGTTVSAEITGSNFMSNLTASLKHSGETSIAATRVTWVSSSSVTATFDLPNSTKVGSWDIVITNPNRLSGEMANYFVVHGNKSAT
jgi:hypothetical protein